MGETSGHLHVIYGANTFQSINGQIFVQVEKHTMLQHELADGIWTGEHHPIEVEAGVYEVIQQREQDMSQTIRQVQD